MAAHPIPSTLGLTGAALRNGVTREEIREVLLQAMIYCGVPAANSAFKQAREVFAQMEREEGAS